MKRSRLTKGWGVLLLLAGPAWAEPPKLGIPDEIKPANGYAVYVPGAECAAKAVTYVGLSGEYPLPSALLADKRAFVFPTKGLAPGAYRFVAIGSLNDEHAAKEFVVTVPGPPTPPAPPGPPADPLTPALRGAYLADGKPAAAAKALAAVYRQAGRDGGAADDPGLTTLAGLLAELHAAGQAVAPDPSLAAVRAVIKGELAAKFGTAPAAQLDAPARAACKTQFARLAGLLEALP